MIHSLSGRPCSSRYREAAHGTGALSALPCVFLPLRIWGIIPTLSSRRCYLGPKFRLRRQCGSGALRLRGPVLARVSAPGSFRFRGAKSRPPGHGGTLAPARPRPRGPRDPGPGRGQGPGPGCGAAAPGSPSRAGPEPSPRRARPRGRGGAAAAGPGGAEPGAPAGRRRREAGAAAGAARRRQEHPGQVSLSRLRGTASGARAPARHWLLTRRGAGAAMGWGSGEAGASAGGSRPDPPGSPPAAGCAGPGTCGRVWVGLCKLLFRASGTYRDASGEIDWGPGSP